jgi:hypothetical protein
MAKKGWAGAYKKAAFTIADIHVIWSNRILLCYSDFDALNKRDYDKEKESIKRGNRWGNTRL